MQKPALVCESKHKFAKVYKNLQIVCKSLQNYAKACGSMQNPAQVHKHILSKRWHLFPAFFQILWRIFPAFLQIWDDFSKKKTSFCNGFFRRHLMALLTIFYGFFVLLFVQYKIRLTQYKTLITFFRGGCKNLS
jgi:hypothetical protein